MRVGMNNQGRLPQFGRLAAMTAKKLMSLGRRSAQHRSRAGWMHREWMDDVCVGTPSSVQETQGGDASDKGNDDVCVVSQATDETV